MYCSETIVSISDSTVSAEVEVDEFKPLVHKK